MTIPYIPDRIRHTRTDRLVHIRESLHQVSQRFLPNYFIDRRAAHIVWSYDQEIRLINAELHRRELAVRPANRKARDERYQADWR